ncbi:MAG: aminotransferase class I/II-fold pyridoxal phosphate-dependent enzyme [Candidatus Azobacteroides sp.]|nr:aminotransferase class I/II-fold pyridoxal phosphate-dependent enzyme [Candidatus Azobacteroides sp.]
MEKPQIYLSIAHPSGKEKQYISEAIDSNWITTAGPQIVRFEKALESYLDTPNPVVTLSSGTAALHLALIDLGIEPGDEVICQDLTFVATINPVKYVRAIPILVDSEKDTWNISPDVLKETIADRIKKTGKKPKAIIAVDLYGMPARLPEIIRIAADYEIPVIEDAAESLGSYITINNRRKFCSTFGDCGYLSFNGNKIITASTGGALICRDEAQAARIRFLSGQAKDSAPHYQHSQLGYNYNLSNICAAVGLAQMEVLQKHVERRREIRFRYQSELSLFPELEFQNELPNYVSNYWLTCVLFPSETLRDEIKKHLEMNRIESRPIWKPMHLQPLYKDSPYYGTKFGEYLFERGLCLPSSSILKDDDITNIAALINNYLKNHG